MSSYGGAVLCQRPCAEPQFSVGALGVVEKIRLADVEHVPPDDLVSLISDRFDNLVTVAVAEAVSGYVPQRTRRLLRQK